jgi:hypothetical protein
MTMPGRLGRSLLSLLLATVVAGLSSAAALALVPTVTFDIGAGDQCFAFKGPASTTIDFVIRGSNG